MLHSKRGLQKFVLFGECMKILLMKSIEVLEKTTVSGGFQPPWPHSPMAQAESGCVLDPRDPLDPHAWASARPSL